MVSVFADGEVQPWAPEEGHEVHGIGLTGSKILPDTEILHNSVRPWLIFVFSTEGIFQAHKPNSSKKSALIPLLNEQEAKYF
jgi:hypothetical protein